MHLMQVGIEERTNPRRGRHTHEQPELLLVVDGCGRQLSVRGEEACAAGDVFVFPAGQPHNSAAGAGERFTCLVLNGEPGDLVDARPGDGGAQLWARIADQAQADNRLHIRPATAQRVRALMGRAVREFQAQAAGSRCASRALVMESLVTLVRDPLFGVPIEEGPAPADRHLDEALRWLELYWMQEVQVADLVALGPLGRSQFLARFHARTGRTVGQALLAIRVREAQRMLRGGEGSMLDIALSCGFGSQSHFNHRFRAVTGCSPRTWLRAQVAG